MVRVVSPRPVRTKRVTCPNCAYELEFTGEDVTVSVNSDGDSMQFIRCPRQECRSGHRGAVAISVRWP
jgi:RNase P subunit RPR2